MVGFLDEFSSGGAHQSTNDRAGFLRDKRGVAAVEMGLIAAPFLLLIAAILEYSYGNFAQSRLDGVVQQAARQIMTGYVQNQSASGQALSAAQFRAQIICPKLPAIMNCNDFYVDVQTFDAPASGVAPATTPFRNFVNAASNGVTPAALDNSKNAYCVGGPKKYVVLRAAYPVPILTTGVLFPNSTTYNGRKSRVLTSTATFKNEPFPTSNVGC
jgi:Flp pilus assembly protein TadG